MADEAMQKNVRRPVVGGSVFAASLAVNILSLALPLAILQIFDRVVPNEALSTLLILMIGLGAAMALDFALKVCRIIETTHAAEDFELSTSSLVARRLLNATPGANQGLKAVERFEALSSVSQLRDQHSGESRLTAIDLPFVIIFVAAVAWIGGPLALVLVASFAVLCLISLILRARQRRLFADRRTLDARRYSFVGEFLAKAGVIKANAMEMPMLRRYERLQEQSVEASRRLSVLNGLSQASSATMSQATLGAVALFGGYMVIEGSLGLAELAACTLLSGRAIQPMLKLTSLWVQAENVTAAEARCAELLALPQRLAAPTLTLKGEIVFDQVALRPPGREDFLFEDLSFRCPPGSCVAVTGDDGVGKSSLLRLIMGEQTPDRGQVLLDGAAAAEFIGHRGPGRIAYIDREPTIFETSIERNITLSNDPDRIRAALRLSDMLGLTEAVNRLPHGFETVIGGKSATPLPEGTLQVIALVRALAMALRILLFNEANSAMDVPSDKATLAALRALRGETTVVMVTRRPSYVAAAERQVALTRGGASVFGVETSAPPTRRRQTTPRRAASGAPA